MRIGSTLGTNATTYDPNSHLERMNNTFRARRAKEKAFQNFCQAIDDKRELCTSATNRAPEQAQPEQKKLFDPEAAIQKVVEQNAAYLGYKISQIFEEDKSKLLSGKSEVEYNNSLDELTRAVEGQDFDNAKKILKEFYNGDSELVINKIEETLTQVEDKFWGDMRKVLGQMGQAQGLTLSDGIQEETGISGYDLVERAIENARQKTGSLKDMDFSDLIDEVREDAVDYAARTIREASNEASEDSAETQAKNAVQAASLYTKHTLYGVDGAADKLADQELNMTSRIEEQKNNTSSMRILRYMTFADIQESTSGQTISNEQLSRSAGLGISSNSKFSQQLSKMGATVVDELKELTSKTRRDGPSIYVEELSGKDKQTYEMNKPADFVGNEDWRSFRDDVSTLFTGAIEGYVGRSMNVYKSIQNNANSSNYSSFSRKI
ncbi:hypothetical protein [Maridesulfovibrio salexigens]|uniref:Uncharacterized protein n=1 Tax=Maridesulfovibrio salexigens (strain ATCC 14822 / DSM 2638 / NCIMB 8403 / VKM B-1763) TaxID=526222 RepID=C6BZ92_MARSD|nr:hypothetical protein [Maridesulfovibrio salexigens]ACS78916.1 hypothetical protein Desal_0850 [Maridesulfovibrio salexigens DSM 2638]